MAATSLFAVHLLHEWAYAASSHPRQWTSAHCNGKRKAGHTCSRRELYDLCICCIDRCSHCSLLSRAAMLCVSSMYRRSPTSSSVAAVILTSVHLSSCMTHHLKAQRCWPRLAWWLLDMCVINAFQLWSKGQQHGGQLRFREELMHELIKQLPAEQVPRKRGAGLHPVHALASEHYPLLSDVDRDCHHCSKRSTGRKRSRIICAECGVHLCIGACFAAHHSID
jgi:hypothetical protein